MLTKTLKQFIKKEYGNKGAKAVKMVESYRVKRYKDFFVVVGGTDEYVVEGGLCTCEGFLYNANRNAELCSHQIAVQLAKEHGMFDVFDKWYFEMLKI